MNEEKLMAFMGKAVGDMGAAISNVLALIGDRLGLYKALAKHGPQTSAQLAANTGTNERYIREWLSNQAAGGYVTYDPATQRFHLEPEQAFALADESSPVFLGGGFQVITAAYKAADRATENFKSGAGMAWGDHDRALFEGTERFFRSGYNAHLVAEWLPALTGRVEKLVAGARVADVGCGHGASTIVMAKAFPQSKFHGFDFHPASIEKARERAQAAGVSDRVTFEVARASDYPGRDYDLVTHFDCLHDMGDPAAAAKHVRETLAEGGSWMLVEPFAGDRLEDNLNPVGRVYYGASTLVCVPASLAQDGIALGAQAGEARLHEIVIGGGGFKTFRVATQTPFNLVFEARA